MLLMPQVFEMPGCDHRGASTDPRMLGLLRGVLGLAPSEETAKLHHELQGRKTGCCSKQTRGDRDNLLYGLIAKFGFQPLNTFRSISNTFRILSALLVQSVLCMVNLDLGNAQLLSLCVISGVRHI